MAFSLRQCCMSLLNLLIQTMHCGFHWFSCWLSSAHLMKHMFGHTLTLIDHSVLAVFASISMAGSDTVCKCEATFCSFVCVILV